MFITSMSPLIGGGPFGRLIPGNESPSAFDIAMAKSFVNDFTHMEKQFKGRIVPFKSVVRFAAGSLLPASS